MRPAPLLIAGLACLALTAAAAAQDAAAASAPYFMEFRARSGGFLGHTFVVYGRMDGSGHAHEAGYAGLYPDDKYDESLLPAVIPVRSYVNVKKEDPSLAVGAVYRRRLNAGQYAHLMLTLRRLQSHHSRWHLFFYNCNDFAGQVAREMGLWTPPSLVRPNVYVRTLRAINGP